MTAITRAVTSPPMMPLMMAVAVAVVPVND